METECSFCWKKRPVNQLPCPSCGTAMPYNGMHPCAWPEEAAGRYGKKKGTRKTREVLESKGALIFHDPLELLEQDVSSFRVPQKMLVFSVLQSAYVDTIRLRRARYLTPSLLRRAESDLSWIQVQDKTTGFSFSDCCSYLGFSDIQQKKVWQFFFDILTEALQKKRRSFGGFTKEERERRLVTWEIVRP